MPSNYKYQIVFPLDNNFCWIIFAMEQNILSLIKHLDKDVDVDEEFDKQKSGTTKS